MSNVTLADLEPQNLKLMGWSAAFTLGDIRGVQRRRSMEIHTLGIDLGKMIFHLVGLNAAGEAVVRKKFSRK
jgi:hypothetical protein